MHSQRREEAQSWRRDKSSAVKIGSVSDSWSVFGVGFFCVCVFVLVFFCFVFVNNGSNNFPKCPAGHLIQTAGWLLLHMQ